MKRIIIYSTIFTILTLLGVSDTFILKSVRHFYAKKCPTLGVAWAQEYAFERSSDFNKLDLRARSAWRDAMRAGDQDKMFSCLIKVERKMSQRQMNALAGTGFKPGTIIQTIVTGNVSAKDLPALAGLDFVKAVELARPMGVKEDPGYQKYGAPRRVWVKPRVKKEEVVPKAKVEEKPAEAPRLKPVEPVQQIEAPVAVPIYQTAPAAEVERPIPPPTTPETPSEAPAVAPVDQGTPVVQPGVRPTQPVVEQPRTEQPVVQPSPTQQTQTPTQQPQYAPTQ